MIFNEDKLQEEIIKTWGEFGVHNEVFKAMKKQISDLKQLNLTDVVSMCCDETRKVNQFLKRPSKYCMTCSKELN